mgnify:CR=1 FL=1
MYDLQRRAAGVEFLNDDDRSAIRRGLQASREQAGGGSQASHPAYDVHRSVSEAGGPAPSDAPPPSLPPGAPSSAASGSVTKSDRVEHLIMGHGGGGALSAPVGLKQPTEASRWHIPPPLTWEEADRQFYADKAAREAARLEAEPATAAKPAKRRRPSDGGQAAKVKPAMAASQPPPSQPPPPIYWSDPDRGDLREFPRGVLPGSSRQYVEMGAKKRGPEEAAAAPSAAALCSITASLLGHAPLPCSTEQRAASLSSSLSSQSSSEPDRKPHTERAGFGCSGAAALSAPRALAPSAEPAFSDFLFPTAALVLAEALAAEEAERAERAEEVMAEMAEMVDDEVVDSIADHMAEMVDDEVVDALAHHMVRYLDR